MKNVFTPDLFFMNILSDLENGDDKPYPLQRSISKISTIPEEDLEHEDAFSTAGSIRNLSRIQIDDPNDPKGLKPLSRAFQVPNRIRRLRSRHIKAPKNLWFTGSVDKSFNSKASKRFDTKDLEEDAVHYYYYRSLPKISNQESYLPSITTSLENIPETPKLPKVNVRREDLLL